MTEILAYGYSSESTQRELSNEYKHDMGLDRFQKSSVLVLWTKVALALEGLTRIIDPRELEPDELSYFPHNGIFTYCTLPHKNPCFGAVIHWTSNSTMSLLFYLFG